MTSSITTKLWNADQGYDSTLTAFDASLDRLGIDHLDLYLIHWPMPAKNTFVETFKAFAHLHDQGRVSLDRGEQLRARAPADPDRRDRDRARRQPGRAESAVYRRRSCAKYTPRLGIATEAWAPLGQGSLLGEPIVTAVSESRGKTPAQVLIRWHIQLGNIVIPKSVTPERIVSNFDVFDFELTEQDMASISSLGDGTRLGPDPRTFN